MADALALSVSGRGAAEAAPQRLPLAAGRPPAAGEGHGQQLRHPHPGPLPGTHPRPLTPQRRPVPRRQLGKGEEKSRTGRRRPAGRLTTNEEGASTRAPGTSTNQRLKWAGRAEEGAPSLPRLLASSRLFGRES